MRLPLAMRKPAAGALVVITGKTGESGYKPSGLAPENRSVGAAPIVVAKNDLKV